MTRATAETTGGSTPAELACETLFTLLLVPWPKTVSHLISSQRCVLPGFFRGSCFKLVGFLATLNKQLKPSGLLRGLSKGRAVLRQPKKDGVGLGSSDQRKPRSSCPAAVAARFAAGDRGRVVEREVGALRLVSVPHEIEDNLCSVMVQNDFV